MTAPSLTVVIPTYNGKERLQRCLESLALQTRPPDAVIVVDDASTDGTAEMIESLDTDARVVALERNSGFCVAVNRGVALAETDAVMTLNDDMTLAPECLALLMAAWDPGRIVGPLVVFAEAPEIVYAAGDRLLPNGRPESMGFREPVAALPFSGPVASITAGAAVYPRALLAAVGGFDEGFVAYFDDMDVGLRARWVGVEPVLVPDAIALHEGGASIRDRLWWRTRQCWRNHLLLVIKHWPAVRFRRDGAAIAAESFAGMRRTFGAVRSDRGAVRAVGVVAAVLLSWCWAVPQAWGARRRIACGRTVQPVAFDRWLSRPENHS